MGDEKRYYWLKLPEDFYDDDTIQWIEDQENGQAYVNFYLKLLLKSLVDDGYLVRYVGSKLIPYDIKSLARLTNTDPDTVRVAMNLFKEIGLIEMLDSGEIFMSQIEEMIGTETQAARRMRKLRAKESVKAISNDNRNNVTAKSNKVTDERNNVTNQRNAVQKCYTEKEIEIERELEIDIEVEEPAPAALNKSMFIDKWNALGEPIKTIKKLNSNTQRYKMLKARISEYGENEVLKAIDIIKNSKFLYGNNDTEWIITFDWFVGPNNFPKVLEGNYLDKNKNAAVDDNAQGSDTSRKGYADRARAERFAKMMEER